MTGPRPVAGYTDTVPGQFCYHCGQFNVSMKNPGLEDLLALIETQRGQIERLERQVNSLTSARTDQVNQNDNQTDPAPQTNTNSEKRLQDLEDVVIDIKGEMMELMFVYQDVQDKLFDIDRSTLYKYVYLILMCEYNSNMY